MARPLVPLLNTTLFTILVPGTVLVYIPYLLTDHFSNPARGSLMWITAAIIGWGGAVYFRCAGEFAVRGLGTPAPIAPTKYLVTTCPAPLRAQSDVYRGTFCRAGRDDPVSLAAPARIHVLHVRGGRTFCAVL